MKLQGCAGCSEFPLFCREIVKLQWLKTFGTMKRCSRQGYFELMSVNYSARKEAGARKEADMDISFSFSTIK